VPNQYITALTIMLAFTIAGCTGNIELVGYGAPSDVQHGLRVGLLGNGPSGALITIENTSGSIISMNQSRLAMIISVKKRKGEQSVPVEPCERIMIHMHTSPRPDDFIIMAPHQNRSIPVPVSYKGNQYHTLDRIYRIEKGSLYEVEVRLEPYFGTFTEKTAEKTLADFMIPNYLREPLTMNTMTIRAR
jgi:hypothetical protein